jgi:hypothetical protein
MPPTLPWTWAGVTPFPWMVQLMASLTGRVHRCLAPASQGADGALTMSGTSKFAAPTEYGGRGGHATTWRTQALPVPYVADCTARHGASTVQHRSWSPGA